MVTTVFANNLFRWLRVSIIMIAVDYTASCSNDIEQRSSKDVDENGSDIIKVLSRHSSR
jgi:hypothetical protein